MKITNPRIDWMVGYGNHPHIIVTIDELPKKENLFYATHKEENGTAYFSAHESGYVSYFYHNPRNERGFGGAVFEGNLIGGGRFKVKGPWSSNSQSMNQWFPRSMEITFDMPEGYLLAAHMIESRVLALIKEAGAEYRFITGYGSDDEVPEGTPNSVAVIVYPGMTIRESQSYKNRCRCVKSNSDSMAACPIHGISAQLNRSQME